ncbi:hypothetical protein BDK51DRAFT_28194 [Blyttiomyces helicus]|uniref:Nitrogen regulatory protein areA GATA-like domain-containing protein n=1 Tax=Blyttiomyces helicus TaxID=388810 RepID=A0A4P9WAQ9_9FUNG|nr:hypothetical protein BDK51DRAFT_28194 [Blyttiomyces helicus]|eukprot:RKO88655.1 hypothetical protein BDK51DRAFT_28194 [Blyttiomyces helicus]
MPTQLAEPVLTLALNNLQKLTSIEEKDIQTIWNVFTKCKDNLENGRRLENISWRLWYRSCHGIPDKEGCLPSGFPASVPIPDVAALEETCYDKASALKAQNVSPSSFNRILKNAADTHDDQCSQKVTSPLAAMKAAAEASLARLDSLAPRLLPVPQKGCVQDATGLKPEDEAMVTFIAATMPAVPTYAAPHAPTYTAPYAPPKPELDAGPSNTSPVYAAPVPRRAVHPTAAPVEAEIGVEERPKVKFFISESASPMEYPVARQQQPARTAAPIVPAYPVVARPHLGVGPAAAFRPASYMGPVPPRRNPAPAPAPARDDEDDESDFSETDFDSDFDSDSEDYDSSWSTSSRSPTTSRRQQSSLFPKVALSEQSAARTAAVAAPVRAKPSLLSAALARSRRPTATAFDSDEDDNSGCPFVDSGRRSDPTQVELTESLRQNLAWDRAMPFNTRLARGGAGGTSTARYGEEGYW